ncbi:MAG TPA: hypothetical protein VFM41_08445 [Gaiella sp.]|nr:hypothetical protein [Gaiella sp.]
MASAENPPATAAPGVNGGVDELRRELARERGELAAAVGRLEGTVADGRRMAVRRFAMVGALLASFVTAGVVAAFVRAALRRRRRERVVARLGDLVLVRRPVRSR